MTDFTHKCMLARVNNNFIFLNVHRYYHGFNTLQTRALAKTVESRLLYELAYIFSVQYTVSLVRHLGNKAINKQYEWQMGTSPWRYSSERNVTGKAKFGADSLAALGTHLHLSGPWPVISKTSLTWQTGLMWQLSSQFTFPKFSQVTILSTNKNGEDEQLPTNYPPSTNYQSSLTHSDPIKAKPT